jgi:DNA-binding transcriptional LysR family regulator
MACRVVVPAAWRGRIAGSDWARVASLPWVIPPPISSHHAFASELFQARGQTPETIVEADDESVVRSLVIAGLGAGLMREDLALAAERAGAVAIWPGARLETTLQFIHARERTGEPAIAALVALVADTWNDDRTRVAAATEATAG